MTPQSSARLQPAVLTGGRVEGGVIEETNGTSPASANTPKRGMMQRRGGGGLLGKGITMGVVTAIVVFLVLVPVVYLIYVTFFQGGASFNNFRDALSLPQTSQ